MALAPRRSRTAGGIDAVYFEEVRRHVGVDAAHAYGGFLAHHGVVRTLLRAFRIVAFLSASIKKHATGKGNGDEKAVIAAIKAKGFDPSDDNEADALALLDWA